MRFLVSIPCLFGESHTRMAIDSVVDSYHTDLLLIDNGAPNDVKAVLNHYHSRPNVNIISNPENIYVNPAWNQAMKFFIEHSEYDYLILMNSDLIMDSNWSKSLFNFLSENKKKIPVSVITDHIHDSDNYEETFNVLTGGIAGVFIIMDREAVEIVNPIPEYLKIWFGDNVIYDILRGVGYEIGVLNNLRAIHYHNGSQNVGRVDGISELIESDKKEWLSKGMNHVKEIIAKFSDGKDLRNL